MKKYIRASYDHRYSAGRIEEDGTEDFYYDTGFDSWDEAVCWGDGHDCTHIYDRQTGEYLPITSAKQTKYFANMVSASSFDSAYDENDNLYQFHVAGYLGDDYRGLMEDWYTNDFEEALEHAFGMGSQGLFVEIENQVDGRSRKLTPEEWEDAAEWGEYPDHIREDLAL